MRRLLLSPRWLALHALVLGVIVAFLRLGWWQWDRAHSPTGGLQSLGYSLQWPVFALFVLFLWGKTIREELRRPTDESSEPPATEEAGTPEAEASLARTPRPRPSPVDEEPDEELAAYNAYLARLHERTGRQTR